MKKEQNTAAFSPSGGMEMTDTVQPGNMPPYLQLKKEFAGALGLHSNTTALLSLPLDDDRNRAIKRGIDLLVSVLVIVLVLSWLIPLLAFFIKISSPGPAFFFQKRNKRNGELFTCIKFRTMVKNEDADTLPACKDDKRITRAGRFLRRHHLDELPQFFNVLWGDMSLVGPRPHMVSDNIRFDTLIKNYSYRSKVKPGITGLAQAMGYVGETHDIEKMKARVNMDIHYLRHWSLKLDMAILYRTICKTFGL